MSTPSTPSPAARHFAILCQRSGRGTGGHLIRFRAMPSPHLATTSPANSSHRASPRRSAILPASFNSSSILQVVRAGQPARAGDSFPLTPSTLSTLPWCLGIYADTPEGSGGGRVDISGRRGYSARKFVSGFSARLYRSKYQLFIFSARLCRATPVHLGNSNCT